jgi:hypothetical protein
MSARIAAMALLATLLASCKERQTQIRLTFPNAPDGGTCAAQTNIKCANYIQISAGTGKGFRSECTPIDVALTNLCDLADLARGQELIKLSPDTVLPLVLEGQRVFPATSCNSGVCPAKTIFRGETAEQGPIANFEGQVLEIPVTLVRSCGIPEQFFFLPEGRTCTELCGAGLVVCDGVQGGCLCLDPEAHPTAGAMDGGQDAIDSGQ